MAATPSPPSPATELSRLRAVFERELEQGAANSEITGGLDTLLIRMVDNGVIARGHPLYERIRGLQRGGGYRGLTEEGRRKWLERAIPAAGLDAGDDVPAPAAASGRKRPLAPDDPVTRLPGIGKSAAERFEKLGVTTAGDAALFFPRRFRDFTDVRRISDLEPDGLPKTVVGTILKSGQLRYGRRVRGSEAIITDGSGSLRLVWFNMPWVHRGLKEGEEYAVSGAVTVYRGRMQMANPPEYEPFDSNLMRPGRLLPIYPGTQGLGQRTIRRAVGHAVEQLADRLPDPVPGWLAKEEGLEPFGDCVSAYHTPETLRDVETTRQRLALGEFLAIQVAVLQRRAAWQHDQHAPELEFGAHLDGYLDSLPFRLTNPQRTALDEILVDIGNTAPMLRLLQGDVGSGKTVVAFAAMLAAVAAGRQAALMAPTEILAEQHYRSLVTLLGGGESAFEGMFAPDWLDQRPLRAALLTGSRTAAEKKRVREAAAHGGADIVIGTHAIIEEAVELPRLALAVIDEQHRFGVDQRARLRQKGANPHLLVMTATPIPRTLALTVYGDLEVSTIDELPPGRLPVITSWVEPGERDEAYDFLRERLDAKEQAFVICPLVDESEVLDVRSAEEEFERLRSGPLAAYRLDLLHGRMSGRQKDEVMSRFGSGETDVLVSTSVVEVGIDVPNATTIVIEGAERFGLSQLHQFRGRVGRSDRQGYCLLFSSDEDPNPDAQNRLRAMERTTDGFELAEVDLEMRGEGEAWGMAQSGGNGMLRVARVTDRDLLTDAREMARRILARDPLLQKPEHRGIAMNARPFLETATEAN
ncbi:MAG: ATP-dependent DNA helicase RecG [Chloroflexota bacterium]|nr:ATP-dependent DNA helicase RecG [Chloroflexota bacterium]